MISCRRCTALVDNGVVCEGPEQADAVAILALGMVARVPSRTDSDRARRPGAIAVARCA